MNAWLSFITMLASYPALSSLLALFLIILLCLFVLLIILTIWRSSNSKMAMIASCNHQYPYPGPDFTAMRFKEGIVQQEWPNDNGVVYQPMEIIFHADFQPQPDYAIAVHFKGVNQVLVTSVPLAK